MSTRIDVDAAKRSWDKQKARFVKTLDLHLEDVGELRGENYFYDAETHRRLFSLPLYLRRELAKSGDVFA